MSYDLNKIYKNVRNYKDLIEVNKEFIKGNVPYTHYYADSFLMEEDIEMDPLHIQNAGTLLKLHDRGIYTIEGQSGFSAEPTILQRSYLEFFLNLTSAFMILPKLFSDDRIYISMTFPDKIRYIDNMPDPVVVLTTDSGEPFTTWKREGSRDYEYITEMGKDIPHVACFVIVKNVGSLVTAADIVLQHKLN